MKRSLATRLTLYIVSITTLLFVAAIIYVGTVSLEIINKDAEGLVSNKLDAVVGDMEEILSEVEASVKSVAWEVEDHKNDPNYMYYLTRKLVESNDYIVGSAVAFRPFTFGQEYYSPYTYIDKHTDAIETFQLGSEDNDYPMQEWYQIPELLKKEWWSEPYFDEGGGRIIMITYSLPLLDDKGEVYAVLTADLSLKDLTMHLDEIRPYENSYIMLVSRNGSFVAHKDTANILNETIFSSVLEQSDTSLLHGARSMMEGQAGVMEFSDSDTDYFAVYAPVKNGWSMAIITPYDDVTGGWIKMCSTILISLVLGLALLTIISRVIIKRLTKPLSLFSDSAREIAKGNFHVRLPQITSKDEMEQLHDSFEYMQSSLSKHIEQLKATTAAKQRIESEISIARSIQLGMVPKDFPDQIYAILRPAKEVGGDLYDFHIRTGFLYFAIGDVSGKGIPAALYMSLTRSALRFMNGLGLSIGEMAGRVNNIICDGNKEEMFVTFFLGILNIETGELLYCNAGHNPLVIISPNGEAKYLPMSANLVGGAMPDFQYKGESVVLEKGTRLILYTDGVTEAERADKQQYGEERLLSFAQNITGSAKEISEALLADVKAFTCGAEQNDDITIMTIEY